MPRLPRSALAPVAALALGGLILSSPLMASTAIRGVTLSTAGLALIEAEGTLGAAPLTLSIARTDIDDFLKSLLVLDPEGAVARIRLTGPGSFEDAFAHLPLGPGDVTDPARLLAAMAGAPVRAERRGEVSVGQILGVSQRPGEHGSQPVLALRGADGGLRSLLLDEATVVTLTDPADQAVLDQALAALRAGANPHRVAVALDSDRDTERQAGLVWLQAAPLWRTAWRAIDTPDGLRLVGWAVVENTTGMDWDGIRLTLATGAIRAIEAQLYARAHARREPAQVIDPLARSRIAPAPALAAMAPLAEMGDMADMAPAFAEGAAAGVAPDDGATFSRFTLETPVTLAAGQMISLPFLTETLPGARLTLYRGGLGLTHPEIALELVNPLPLRLPAGVLTLYEEGRGHAGDATIPELAPGARETVRVGLDTAVEIRETTSATETLRALHLARGVLTATEDLERRITYRIRGADRGERVVTLDHPRRAGWAVSAATGPEERLDAWRWQLPVAEGATESLVVTERQPRVRRMAVADMDTAMVIAWAGQSPDAELRDRLNRIADLRRQIAEAEQAIRRSQAEGGEMEREQARLVNLIVQLGDDSAANRDRRARVDAIDAALAAAAAARADLADRLTDLRARMAALIDA